MADKRKGEEGEERASDPTGAPAEEPARGTLRPADTAKTTPPPDTLQTVKPPDDLSPEESIPTIAPPVGTLPPGQDPRPSSTPDLTERYEIRGFIGEGGMGLVYKAYDKELEEEIAIKVLQRQFMLNENDIARFKREIKTARKIGHANIIRIYDFGIADREAFISMELLPGGTLNEREAKGRIPLDEAIPIAIEIADGLGAAHSEGVIHRDIKPHNVLFDAGGRVKLVDFGIARFATNETVTQGVLGTPHYMSPEQADGTEADIRSDVYSLGVLMFELFTGELPFKSNSLTKILVMQVNEPAPGPRTIDSELPFALERIILKCLEKNPDHRYQDGREVAAALREYLEAREAGLPDLPDESQTRALSSGGRRRNRVLIGVGLGVLVVAGGAFGLYQIQEQMQPTPTPVARSSPAVDGSPAVAASQTALPTTAVAAATPTRTRRARTPTPNPTPSQTAVVTDTNIIIHPKPWGEVTVQKVGASSPLQLTRKAYKKRAHVFEKVEPGSYQVTMSNPAYKNGYPETFKIRVTTGQTFLAIYSFGQNKPRTEFLRGSIPAEYQK